MFITADVTAIKLCCEYLIKSVPMNMCVTCERLFQSMTDRQMDGWMDEKEKIGQSDP